MSVSVTTRGSGLSANEAPALGVKAYVYLYPLVTMELARRQMTNAPVGTVVVENA